MEIFDLRLQLEAVHSSSAMSDFIKQEKEATPLFSFAGHMSEGFAIDWSPKVPGELCRLIFSGDSISTKTVTEMKSLVKNGDV